MYISELLSNPIVPFEIEDMVLQKLFSFFLHLAPTIDSKTAANIPEDRLIRNWAEYVSYVNKESFVFLAPNCVIENHLEKHGFALSSQINRKSKGFICKRKDKNEPDYVCLLRHLRNSIAHSNVYLSNAGNRKYLLFEDFNQTKKQSARILLSQSDLKRLKDTIMR